MSLCQDILNRKEKISVIGLGYVGMPIAVAFAKKADVIGFDLNACKIEQYRNGYDSTKEVGDEEIKSTTMEFTNVESDLKQAKFHIIAVPTPINCDKTPDLDPIANASRILGRNLSPGSVVVYESTVYPGVTEEFCIPILEKESGLTCGKDFKIGYSPERINPGDKVHRLENIKKIVSGMDKESLETIASIYELIITAGVHKVTSIKVAEAAKVVENSQRDINIAFMNELAMVFDRMGIDTNEVVDAMNTKWNALGFRPGLVGGHCIGVDPYYFIYQAENLGYHSQIIASGRKVNDGMGSFVAEAVIKKLILEEKPVKSAKVVILGITFKENCPDTRNTKVIDIIQRLEEYGIIPIIADPWADRQELEQEYSLQLTELDEIQDADCVVFAVAHHEFRTLSWDKINGFYPPQDAKKILIDVKGIFDTKELDKQGYSYWRL